MTTETQTTTESEAGGRAASAVERLVIWIDARYELPHRYQHVLAWMPNVDFPFAMLYIDCDDELNTVWVDASDKSYDPNGEVAFWMELPDEPDNI